MKIGQGEISDPELSELSIFVWNVYKGQRLDVFEHDFKKFGSGKDFILLQEALVDNRMPLLWKEDFSAYEWHLAQSFHYKKDMSSTGVAIGSKFSPVSIEFIRSRAREFFWLTPKLTIFGEYEVMGQRILFVCTHVLNFVMTSAFTESLYEIAERISKFSGPVILAGDFNTWNIKRYLIMKSIFRDLQMEHLDLENDGRILKLDHVFVRGFEVLKAEVLHTSTGSDHFPLEIKLKI
jgi:endonuclease/exonuclease/phosphatase (EEP) superfamily protein YafD